MNAPAALNNLKITQPRFSASANVSAPRSLTNSGPSSVSASSNTGGAGVAGFLTGWGGVLLVVLVLMVVFAIYYQTIGYYIQIGWEKLGWSRRHGERIAIDVPGGGPSAALLPATDGGAGASLEASLSGAVSRLESDVEAALGGGGVGPGKKQVFNVARNLYTYGEAEPLCRAFGAELATYDQVKTAYEAGADWCNYGWVKGQQAVYPTQKSTWDKLQHGPEEERLSCGLPGMNGGYFPNADQRFGVNCYGARPAESALDERMAEADKRNISFDREVNHFKAELGSIAVAPWSEKQWSA
jgi:hypothetical protein